MTSLAKKLNKSYKIGIYIRVSTEEQAQNEEGSIRNQEQRLRQHIEYKNQDQHFGDLTDVFIDRARSGKDTNRPELQRMLKMIRSGEINFVMATELSRISRSIKDFSEIWAMMQELGCGFSSLRESFDSSSAAGEMLIFSMANLAQFERRQCSERVAHNFKARTKRGLYDGGCVPLGYELIEGKPGYLNVNEENANTVRKCFEYFLKYETLSSTARALNADGYKLQKYMQGGGRKQRLDFFTVDNLYHILRNKKYCGILTYSEYGGDHEAKAMWDAIIDIETFEKVGQMLTKNKSAKKPHSKERYPYLLTGIIYCKKCGGHLAGKSAWGNTTKVPYYEHAWSTKRGSTLTQRTFDCGNPRRFSGKRLEEVVCDKVLEILTSEKVASRLFEEAQKLHADNKGLKELDRLKDQLYGYSSQIEALAERLSVLPKTVSPTSIFKQMEKVEVRKNEIEQKISELKKQERQIVRKPAMLECFLAFREKLRELLINGDVQVREKIIKRLIHKIEVNPDEVILHVIVDKEFYPMGPSDGSHLFLCPKNAETLTLEDFGQKKATKYNLEAYENIFYFSSSNGLTNGAPVRSRT